MLPERANVFGTTTISGGDMDMREHPRDGGKGCVWMCPNQIAREPGHLPPVPVGTKGRLKERLKDERTSGLRKEQATGIPWINPKS